MRKNISILENIYFNFTYFLTLKKRKYTNMVFGCIKGRESLFMTVEWLWFCNNDSSYYHFKQPCCYTSVSTFSFSIRETNLSYVWKQVWVIKMWLWDSKQFLHKAKKKKDGGHSSWNFGSLSPGTTTCSTPFSVITTRWAMPPLTLSLPMARARAVSTDRGMKQREGRGGAKTGREI